MNSSSGEASNFILSPIVSAVLRQIQEWGVDNIAETLRAKTDRIAKLASEAGPDRLHRMAEAFETTVRYEVAFWEMAMTGEGWPGIP